MFALSNCCSYVVYNDHQLVKKQQTLIPTISDVTPISPLGILFFLPPMFECQRVQDEHIVVIENWIR